MNEITTVGLDLAKNVFHVVCRDHRGEEIKKRMLRRGQVAAYFAQLPACLVGMEACAGAHHWARTLQALGHEVKLIAPQHVKPYVLGNKNDYNDARAIAEAVTRPGMRFVPVKTVAQQDVQALHRLRQARVADRTALINQVRGLLAENGVVIPQGLQSFRRQVPQILEDAENGLSDRIRRYINSCYEHLQQLDAHIDDYTREIKRESREHEAVRRLQSAPGFGPILASVFYSVIGEGGAFKRGRDVSASLGLVPRQHSSGGKQRLQGISKRGDGYLRSLLVHGARSVVRRAAGKEDRLSRWIQRLIAERGVNEATVALANKLARIGWAILHHQTVYRTA